ncbi:hypothetical protein AO387_21310 [Pseudomonas syringae ICMP 11168]|uniref:hypothetical protein n=1 Tax=Pseudomonas syringae TaxID=317 RepID=UPI000730F4FE|nr:hypothetical protein [Pseudomonas syringae]KTB99485.1 hypothetical protein AO387_21310 [Pseudomonas syringae ICMP 11168]
MTAKEILKRFSKIFLKTLWICVVICSVFFLAFVGLILALKGATSEMAAWVQAIGSVAAILAAISIASRQSRAAVTDKLERDRVVLEAIITLSERAGDTVKRLYEKTSPNSISAEHLAYVQASYKEFLIVDLLSLPNVSIFNQVMIVRNNLEAALQQAELHHQYYDSASRNGAHNMISRAASGISEAASKLKLLRAN